VNPNRLELVVDVSTEKGNAQLRGMNQNFATLGTTIAASSTAGSRSIDGLTTRIAAGAAAGSLLAEAIGEIAARSKEWVTEAVRQAAQVERLTKGTEFLAKSRDIDAEAAARWTEQIKKSSFTAVEAAALVNKALVVGMDPAKTGVLAQYAKNVSTAFGGTKGTPAEIADQLMMAIETGQTRGLRKLIPGLLDLAKVTELAELKAKLHGKTLSENEAVMVRQDALIKALASTEGIQATTAGTLAEKELRLRLELEEMAIAIGQRFIPAWTRTVDLLTRATESVKGHADAWAEVLKVVLLAGGAVSTYAGVSVARRFLGSAAEGAVAGVAAGAGAAARPLIFTASGEAWSSAAAAGASGGIAGAMTTALNFLKGPAGIAAIGAIIVAAAAYISNFFANRAQEAAAAETGYVHSINAARALAGRPGGVLGLRVSGGRPASGADINGQIAAAHAALEARGQNAQVLERSEQMRVAAQAAASQGEEKIGAEMAKEVIELERIVKGRRLSAAVMENVETTMLMRVVAMEEKRDADRKARETELFRQRIQNEAEYARSAEQMTGQLLEFEEQRAGVARDARLRGLEAENAQTLPQKIAFESRKADIEEEYLDRINGIKQRLFDLETSRQLAEEQLRMQTLHFQTDEIDRRINDLAQLRDQLRQNIQEQTDASVAAAQGNAQQRQVQLVIDRSRQLFDSLKQQAGGVFDALLTRGSNVFVALGNVFKTAILTAIKDVVTSRIAGALVQMLTGQRVSFAGGAGTGLGGTPVFGAAGAAAGAAGLWGGVDWLGGGGQGIGLGAGGSSGPWSERIPGFGGGAGGGSAASGASRFGGLGSLIGLNNIGLFGGGASGTAGALLSSPLAMLGGMWLMKSGWGGRGQGGWAGAGAVAKDTAGGFLTGASIGMQIGGPMGAAWGAAIGTAVGLGMGLIGLFVHTASQKVREKIKSRYGVDISDKGILAQIVQMAQQNFGGNLDVAISSAPVRDLVQLYAMTTGQTVRGMPSAMQSLALAQSGGVLSQVPNFSNGMPVSGLGGGFPTLGSPAPALSHVSLTLDPRSSAAFLQGQTVRALAQHPRAVQSASLAANRGNAGRRELTALQLSPGTVV